MARLVTKFKYLKPDQDFTKASMCGRVHAYLWDTSILAGAIRSKSQNIYMFALLANLSVYEFLQTFLIRLDWLAITNYNKSGLLCRFEGFTWTNIRSKRIRYRKH